MFSTANITQKLLNTGHNKSDIIALTSIFIVFNMLAATQGKLFIFIWFSFINITFLMKFKILPSTVGRYQC